LAQGYAMVDEPEHAAEVFSLMRDSDLATDAYLDRFFDTGDERQGRSTGGAAYDPSTWSAA
jgi:pentatricopeptide repeat protein